MAQAVTLLTLRNRVRWLSDTVGATARHADADLNTEINSSWQEMRERVSDDGQPLYLVPATGTLTPGQVSGANFGQLVLPSDCAKVYGLDILYNNIRRPVMRTSFTQRNEFYNVFSNATGIPTNFVLYNIGAESGAAVNPGSLALLPAPDQAYPYTLWYLQVWTPITNDAFVFNGVTGWDDYVCWSVVAKLAVRDADMAGQYQMIQVERQRAEERMLRGAAHIQRAGPAKRVDVAAIRRRTGRDAWFRRIA